MYIGWATRNRSALIRIPRFNSGQNKAVRAELRCPDPSSNPYLAFAAMLAAAMDGIDCDMKPPRPLNNINIYELSELERAQMGIDSLPSSLQEAMAELEKDQVIKDALGPETYQAFSRAKAVEWEEFRTHVTDWEVEKYLEVA